MRDSQAKELALMYEEALTVRADQEFEISILKLENQRLKDEISAYVVVIPVFSFCVRDFS